MLTTTTTEKIPLSSPRPQKDTSTYYKLSMLIIFMNNSSYRGEIGRKTWLKWLKSGLMSNTAKMTLKLLRTHLLAGFL